MTEEQKIEVIKLRREGFGYKAVARKLGVTRSSVRSFCNTKRGKEAAITGELGKTPEKKPSLCTWCGKEHYREFGYKYCSSECKALAKEERRAKKMVAVCPTCGKSFVKDKNNRIYCQKECRYKTINCEYCGKEFKRPVGSLNKTCSQKCAGLLERRTHEDYVKEFNSIHKGWLSILEPYTKSEDRLGVKCLKCGNIFTARADKLINKNKLSKCPNCTRTSSSGEERVARWLNKNNIDYKRHQTFEGLRNINRLSYDFAVYDGAEITTLIEYHGRQHYEPIEVMGGTEEFKRQKLHDTMKENYARENGIELIVISYKQYSKTEKILEGVLC